MDLRLFGDDMEITANLNCVEIRPAIPVLASESPFIHG